jgi:multiple sugar transport system ATP-binding protein
VSRIVLEGITKRYQDGTTAVRSLDLSIADGELMVLVGPSGCGKTTALRMVAGLEEITEGTILVDGQPVNDMEPRDRDIAMVFQSYALYPHLTVRDNMAFSLKYRKTPKQEIRRRVEEAARILELDELLGRKPRQLSGGQRQRVAMGRAIVRQPRAFLMDEPLSNLDAKLRVQMRAEIAKLQRSLGVTTIYVTHDQTEAMTLGSRVAVLRHGVLQQVASPQELYRRPANLFVAGFIGSPAMNLIEATLERGAGDSGAADSGAAHSGTAHSGTADAGAADAGAANAGAGGPEVIFGPHRLRVPAGVLRKHPALEKYLGRKVVVGIRPENLEDAALVPDAAPESVLDVSVELREELGAEVNAHCTVGVPPLQVAAVAIGDSEPDEAEIEEVPQIPAIIARLDPRTGIREGERARLHVDLDSLHFFDPATGDTLRGD